MSVDVNDDGTIGAKFVLLGQCPELRIHAPDRNVIGMSGGNPCLFVFFLVYAPFNLKEKGQIDGSGDGEHHFQTNTFKPYSASTIDLLSSYFPPSRGQVSHEVVKRLP